jgi:hypothetical protein
LADRSSSATQITYDPGTVKRCSDRPSIEPASEELGSQPIPTACGGREKSLRFVATAIEYLFEPRVILFRGRFGQAMVLSNAP